MLRHNQGELAAYANVTERLAGTVAHERLLAHQAQLGLHSRSVEVRELKMRMEGLKSDIADLKQSAASLALLTYAAKRKVTKRQLRAEAEVLHSTGLFDAHFYQTTYPEAQQAKDPLLHYLSEGDRKGYNPNPHFNTNWYLSTYSDVCLVGQNPLYHYALNGWQEGRDPSADFSTSFYLQRYADIAKASMNPLVHYLRAGAAESRLAQPSLNVGLAARAPVLDENQIHPTHSILPEFTPAPGAQWRQVTQWDASNKYRGIRRFNGLSPELLDDSGDLRVINLQTKNNFLELPLPADLDSDELLEVNLDVISPAEGRMVLDYTLTTDNRYNAEKRIQQTFGQGKTRCRFLMGARYLKGPLRVSIQGNVPTLLIKQIELRAVKRNIPGDGLDFTYVIPCFNHGEYVQETVDSIHQIGEAVSYEIILVDDGSTDPGTVDRIAMIEATGIKVIRTPNVGLGAARNLAIAKARGRYILPVDSDNRIFNTYSLGSLAVLDTDPNIGVVFSDVKFFGARNSVRRLGRHDPADQFIQNKIDACGVFRRAVWDDVNGYDECMIGYQDWAFWAAINNLEHWKFYHLRDIGFEYRVLANSMVGHTKKFNQEIVDYIAARNIRTLRQEFVAVKHALAAAVEKPRGPRLQFGSTEAPLVSIIVPNFNKESYLTTRLDSIFKQTYQNFEVILLDDASSDGSVPILKAYQKKHPDTQMVVNEDNSGGVFHQWKRGLEMANGDLIWIAECDDYCETTFLERLVPSLASNFNIDIAYAQSSFVDEAGNIFGNHRDSMKGLHKTLWNDDFVIDGEQYARDYMRRSNCIPNASAVLFKRSAIDKFNWDDITKFAVCGDWWVWIKMMLGANVYFCADTLNYFRFDLSTARSKGSQSLKRNSEFYSILRMIHKTVGLSDEEISSSLRDLKNKLQQQLDEHGANELELLTLMAKVAQFGSPMSLRVPTQPMTAEEI